MNSLEFIEKEIHFISVVKNEYKKMLNDERPENQKGYLKTLIKEYEDKLQTLQQIKTELEAWYVCKQNAHINKYENINKKRKENRFDITIWLNTENCGFKSCASYEDCLKVRKALEVN